MTHQVSAELSRYAKRDTLPAGDGNIVVDRFRDTAEVINELRPDYPLHYFCLEELSKRVDLFIENFPGKAGFAVKANGETLVLDHLVKSGIHFFDAASIPEIDLVRTLDAKSIIFYDNPIKSRDEIEQAYFQYGVRSFALDDEIELENI